MFASITVDCSFLVRGLSLTVRLCCDGMWVAKSFKLRRPWATGFLFPFCKLDCYILDSFLLLNLFPFFLFPRTRRIHSRPQIFIRIAEPEAEFILGGTGSKLFVGTLFNKFSWFSNNFHKKSRQFELLSWINLRFLNFSSFSTKCKPKN